MTDLDWDLGEPGKTFLISPAGVTGGAVKAFEVFNIKTFAKGVVIRASRPRDLADLTITLIGFTFSNASGAKLIQTRVGYGGVRIDFAPQHTAEQIRASASHCEDTSTWGPSRVRLSGASRLAFLVPKAGKWTPALTIDDLTDWSTLRPIINRRALARNATDLQSQMSSAFGQVDDEEYKTLAWVDAGAKMVAQLQGPSEGETGLEMAGRLVLSPSEVGGWLTSSITHTTASAPLWSARLDRLGRKTVRAIWSRRMEPGVMPRSPGGVGAELPAGLPNGAMDDDDAGQMLALTYRNHWEIVLQTSIYGLPALRRLAPASPEERTDAPAPSGADGERAPKGGVALPPFPVGFLDELNEKYGYQNQDIGIAIATPFEEADISLTALGGVFDAEWKGDPARLRMEPGEVDGFNLERLSYRAFLGRDSRVVAVDKGFLFPLGIRASFVTVHERRIYPDANENPVSYLIRREFIVCPAKPRAYPATYQPFAGREFPARQVTMRTRVTPDLVEIENVPLDLPAGITLDSKSIFWPRTAGPVVDGASPATSPHFVFEWATEDAITVKSNLIFVKNSEVGKPVVMEALVDYYNKLAESPDESWVCDPRRPVMPRTAVLGGARHRYAAPFEEGDTSFDTISWTLKAEGRQDPEGNPSYVIDGRMEGSDTPPFYPRLEHGLINIQSLDQMMGPGGGVRVKYYKPYVTHGFPERDDANPKSHEIFLQLVDTHVRLAASDQADRSGGLATPSLAVGAVSRRTGLVGGKKQKGLAGGVEIGLGAAADNCFSPADFFDDAKLMGIVPLAEVVPVATGLKNAPKLVQVIDYGARDLIEAVNLAAGRVRIALNGQGGTPGLRTKIDTAITQAEEVFQRVSQTSKYGFEHFYPSLALALQPIRDGTLDNRLKALENATSIAEAQAGISSLRPVLQAVLTATAAVLKDPVPDQFDALFDTLAKFFHDLGAGAEAMATETIAAIADLSVEWLKDAFCEAIDNTTFGLVLFGRAISCEEMINDPDTAVAALADGLYGAALEPLASALGVAIGRARDLEARIQIAADEIRAKVVSAARDAILLIEDQLDSLDPEREDIRDLDRQLRLANDLAADLRRLVAPPGQNLSPKAALSHVNSLASLLPVQAKAAIAARLAELASVIHPVPDSTVEELLVELSASMAAELQGAVIDPLVSDARRLGDRLKVLVDDLLKSGFGMALQTADAAIRLLQEARRVVDLATAARSVPKICYSVGQAAVAIADGLIATPSVIRNHAEDIIKAARALRLPQSPDAEPIKAAILALIAAAEDVVALNTRLETERKRIKLAGEICKDPMVFLDPFAAIIRLRRDLERALFEIAEKTDRIARLLQISAGPAVGAAPDAAVDPNDTAIAEIVRHCSSLYLGATGIEGLEDGVQVGSIGDAVAKLLALPGLAEPYERDLQQAFEEVRTRAAALRTDLRAVLKPDALMKLVEARVSEFADRLDRRLAGYILQSVGFTPAFLAAIGNAGTAVNRALFVGLKPAYEALIGLITRISDPFPDGSLMQAVFRFALSNGANVVTATLDALEAELVEVEQAINGMPDAGAALIRKYAEEESALQRAIKALHDLTLTDFGQALTGMLRDQLRQLGGGLQSLLAQFVPTKIKTEYTWDTQLSEFPRGNAWVFQMVPPESPLANPPHLALRSTFEFDVLSKVNKVSVTGTLQAFEIRLFGGLMDMATITFAKTEFTSKNGSSPSFGLKVKGVELGRQLGFIQALQNWLAPKGSGFYVKPSLTGVEAGYIYDAGILQVGSLQFINVVFRVSAILPFAGGEARFTFALAGPGQPFLVSNPPYGGGGWIVLTCNAQKIVAADVCIVFGGVAAIQFGPLRGQGRIVSGIGLTSHTDPQGPPRTVYTFIALFEAVGQGNIACFSISISIRIRLIQRIGGSLTGEAEYRFSFKVGFLRIKYKVKASYQIDNKKKRKSTLLAGNSSGGPIVRSEIEAKSADWPNYKKRFDLELATA